MTSQKALTRNRPALSEFLCTWHLTRDISHADQSQARFTGTARWTTKGVGAIYRETGVLQMGQTSFQAERRYEWDADLNVYFEDGRFFHRVPEAGTTRHDCAPDIYVVRYDFAEWPRFSTEWNVEGPRKNYRMISRYEPMP